MAVTDSRHHGGAVRLDLHAPAAAETLLPPPKLMIDRFQSDRYTGRKSRKGCHETFTVGLPSRFEAKHLG